MVIPAAVALLVAYQGALGRTSRLRRNIKADVELLAALPADHPSRAALEAHIEVLVDRLIWRERRRFEAITPAGTSFGLYVAVAGAALVAVGFAVMEATGVYNPDPDASRLGWSAALLYTVVAALFAWFAFGSWRRRRGRPGPEADRDGR